MGTGPAFNATPKTDEEAYAQLDFTFDVELGPVRSVKTGIRYSDHNTTSRRFEFDQVAGFDPAIPTSELGGDSTIDVGSGNYQIVEFDPNKAKAIAKASITGRTEDLGAYSEIDEENISAYIMAEFETDVIRGNMGLRYASTDATSTYYTSGELENTSADYSEILPSLNLVYYLDDDVLLRTSAARVMARPQYVDMYVNPNVVGTNDDLPDNQFWIVGNVGLKPFIANQFDMGIEWYFAEGSMVSATYFMKDVKNFVTIREYRADSDDIPFTLVNNPPGQANEYDNGWTVQEKQNGKSADIQGFELQYQQDFGNGFGALVNYTYTDTDVDSDTFTDGNPVLSDSSKNSYNVTGYFENELLQLRLAYNERDEYLLRESGAYGNRLHDSYGSLDFSGEYFINDNFSVTLDVNNILEDESRQFGNNSQPTPNSGFTPGFPLYEYETARRITVGVSAKF
jgi:iron complex outermembrane receptor protein